MCFSENVYTVRFINLVIMTWLLQMLYRGVTLSAQTVHIFSIWQRTTAKAPRIDKEETRFFIPFAFFSTFLVIAWVSLSNRTAYIYKCLRGSWLLMIFLLLIIEFYLVLMTAFVFATQIVYSVEAGSETYAVLNPYIEILFCETDQYQIPLSLLQKPGKPETRALAVLDSPFNAEITSKNVKVKYNIRIAQQQAQGIEIDKLDTALLDECLAQDELSDGEYFNETCSAEYARALNATYQQTDTGRAQKPSVLHRKREERTEKVTTKTTTKEAMSSTAEAIANPIMKATTNSTTKTTTNSTMKATNNSTTKVATNLTTKATNNSTTKAATNSTTKAALKGRQADKPANDKSDDETESEEKLSPPRNRDGTYSEDLVVHYLQAAFICGVLLILCLDIQIVLCGMIPSCRVMPIDPNPVCEGECMCEPPCEACPCCDLGPCCDPDVIVPYPQCGFPC